MPVAHHHPLTTKNASRYCHMSPETKSCQLRTLQGRGKKDKMAEVLHTLGASRSCGNQPQPVSLRLCSPAPLGKETIRPSLWSCYGYCKRYILGWVASPLKNIMGSVLHCNALSPLLGFSPSLFPLFPLSASFPSSFFFMSGTPREVTGPFKYCTWHSI